MKKRSGFGLTAVILSGIETVIFLLLVVFVAIGKNSPSFQAGFEQGFNQAGGANYMFAGYSYSDLINMILMVFLVVFLCLAVKFILSLLGYIKNNSTLLLIAAILASINTALVLMTFNFFIIIFEAVITVFLWITFQSVRSNKNSTNVINKLDDEDKTVIDINK